MGITMPSLLWLVVLLSLAILSQAALLSQGEIPNIPGFNLTWWDDFDGKENTFPNPANWIIDTGFGYPGGPQNWGTGEVQRYTRDLGNLRINGDSTLKITALRDRNGGWTSARIETKRDDFQARRGGKMRIQARIGLPNLSESQALGYWPAFWTLGQGYRHNHWTWPRVGELDIMENVNGVNRVWGAMHCGEGNGGPCHEGQGLSNSLQCPEAPCQDWWHLYTLEIDRSSKPEVARWFVDMRFYHQVTQDQVGSQIWADAIDHGHFILLNMAIGGAFPNAVHHSTTPTSSTAGNGVMHIDWVAVYNS